jgi:maltooligosyltrehalose trehalohydrolase
MRFSVWAPAANSVELIIGEQRIVLEAQGGFWQGEAALSAEQGYRFSVDGGAPVPDPRSRWQRDGVHGASFALDPAPLRQVASAGQAEGFQARPLRDAIVYELHVGTFTSEGTYRAAQGKLAHLKNLGVTHVELLPLATFPGGHGWGYDGVNLYAPLPAYGTPRDLAEFVQACHRSGLAVLLDVVYNHLGPDGNYLGQFGPYFTDRYKTGWGEAVNYDGPQSDEVRRFVIDNALMWLRDYQFDGLRLDAVHAIFSFEAIHVLEELAVAVKQLAAESRRNLVVIAESDFNDPRLVRDVSKGGLGMDAHWCDDFHHAVHRFFTGETAGYYADFNGLRDVATALRDGYVYQGQYSVHRQKNHGRAPRGVGADQLVVCAQNHDQIGNRAQGERLSMLLEPAQLKAIAALTLLSPFVPMLFQGEEWGARTPFLYFTDHNEELGRLVAEGRAREFSSFDWQGEVPNPQDPATFLRSKLDWRELSEAQHADLLEWHRQLIRLRQSQTPGVATRLKPAVKFDAEKLWLTYVHGGVLAVFNFAERPQRVPTPEGGWELVLESEPGFGNAQAHAQMLGGREVPARGTLIYKRRT